MSDFDFGAAAPGAAVRNPATPPEVDIAPPPTDAYETTAPRASASRVRLAENQKPGTILSAIIGFADTVTFGFNDEMDAFESSLTPTWLGGNGLSYAENLELNRQRMKSAEEDHTYAYWGGAIAGAFVPVAGVGGRAKAAVDTVRAGRATGLGRLVVESAAQGALYGAGSSQAEDIFDSRRLKDAVVGGMFGAAGGFVLGSTVIPAAVWGGRKAMAIISRGKTPKLDFKFNIGKTEAAADNVAEDITSLRLSEAKRPAAPRSPSAEPSAAPSAAKAAPKPTNPLTGLADDVVEEGAVFSTKELATGNKQSILDRIAKLTPQEAQVAAKKLQKAMQSGDLAADPHFRSILGLDLEKATDDVAEATKAAEVFEEMTDALLEKAGMGTRTVKGMEDGLRRQFGGVATEADLDRFVAAQQEANGAATVGSTMMALAGVRFAKATTEFLPLIRQGDKAAREALTEALTSAIRISAKGRFLVSSAGRNLGMLSHKRSLAFTEVVDGTMQIEKAEAIRARVNDALSKLEDTELNELLSRVRDLSDLERVQEILLNAASAEKVSNWIKARNTAGLWLKSNSLTFASAVRNVVGFAIHDVFRNGWARDFAEHAARMAGRVEEATIISFQREVSKAVHWQAHGAGLLAAFDRLKWEWWNSVEKIAGTALGQKAVLRATAARGALIERGFRPPEIREFDQLQTLGVQNVTEFNRRLAERASQGGAFALLVNGLERAAASSFSLINELSTATARVVSGGLDDWGRKAVMVKEVYAASAAQATREGLERGLGEKELIDYVQTRSAELAEMPPISILEEVERKLVNGEELGDVDRMLLRRDWEAEREAERVLFMDGPQTAAGRWAAQGATYVDKLAGGFILPGVLMTYIRTPTRIFERGLGSYTPWAAKIEETRAILERGGVEAAIERARMDLGSAIMGIGMIAAASGAITVTNGGYKNSRNLDGGPASRIKLPGGSYVDFQGLDPLSMTISLGAIIGQAFNSFEADRDTYGRDEAALTAIQTAFIGVREAILEKSYMTGARDLLKAYFADGEESFVAALSKTYTTASARLVPLSGVTRNLQETVRGQALEAVGIIDQLMKVTPGMGGYLPARVDPLGNEVEGRTLGFLVGTSADLDQVTRRIADLQIDITALQKADPSGFDLTSEELSELRKIRANEALNSDGMTMKEALGALLDDPDFQALPSRGQKQDAVVAVMGQFNEPARALFEERNQDYLSARTVNRSFQEYMKQGMARYDAAAAAREDAEGQGLNPSRLSP